MLTVKEIIFRLCSVVAGITVRVSCRGPLVSIIVTVRGTGTHCTDSPLSGLIPCFTL